MPDNWNPAVPIIPDDQMEGMRRRFDEFKLEALREIQDNMSSIDWSAATDAAQEAAQMYAEAKMQEMIEGLSGHPFEHTTMGDPRIRHTMIPGPSQRTMMRVMEAQERVQQVKTMYMAYDSRSLADQVTFTDDHMDSIHAALRASAHDAVAAADTAAEEVTPLIERLRKLQDLAP